MIASDAMTTVAVNSSVLTALGHSNAFTDWHLTLDLPYTGQVVAVQKVEMMRLGDKVTVRFTDGMAEGFVVNILARSSTGYSASIDLGPLFKFRSTSYAP